MNNETFEKELLLSARIFLTESGAHRALRTITIDSHLEKDLGIDSLGKMELIHRIETNFNIQLKEKTIAQAETLADLLPAIIAAEPNINDFKHDFIVALEKTEIDVKQCTTLVEVLKQYAVFEPERPHIYLQDDAGQEEIITYGQLFAAAANVASGLVAQGIKAGETIAIMLPTCKEFFFSFFGVLFAGAIPVPIYPPFRADRIEEYAKREAKILQNAEIRILITFDRAEKLSSILKNFIPSLTTVTTLQGLKNNNQPLPNLNITEESPVLIQYTSGSTGDPKGVLLLHKNMLANIKSIGQALKLQPNDVCISWLPLYHDMGLMSWLSSLYFGVPITIMSPLTFLTHPEKWLWAIHYHRGTLTAGPNFAYELCVKKIAADKLEGLDLSCWRLAFNGAEAVNVATLHRFSQKFQAYGFNAAALYPVYGLAENTVALTFPQNHQGLFTDRILKTDFENKQIATIANNNDDYYEFACCGEAIPDHEIRIVAEDGTLLPERHIGNLQFRGPSAMQGYYRNPEASAKIYFDGWWQSGDLAYIANNSVYITGRKKDLIIKAGRNYYPEAIEAVINQLSDIRKGCVVAFGVNDANLGTEKLIIVAETTLTDKEQRLLLEANIIEHMANDIGTTPDEILLVAPKTIAKTSSGKLQRAACKEAYLKHELNKKRTPLYQQLSKLFITGQFLKLQQGLKKMARFFYSIYAFLITGILFIPLWLFAFILPSTIFKKYLSRTAKILFLFLGCSLKIIGKENLPQENAIYIANHASYSDILILLAVLPSNVTLVAKKEIASSAFLRGVIKKLNLILVNRFDFAQNIIDIKTIGAHLEHGESIVLFPEGTFSYASGLRPFKSGAFQLAVDTAKPIVPIAINGARKFLRSGSYLLRPSRITITIGNLIRATSNNWNEVQRLKTNAQDFIAKYCGEARLDILSTAPIIDE